MNSTPSSKKHDLGRRVYRRQDPERRRTERKWNDPAMRRETHALRPGQGHGRAAGRIGGEER
jgi:hypothetical protein